jgi:hypothetical protein
LKRDEQDRGATERDGHGKSGGATASPLDLVKDRASRSGGKDFGKGLRPE